MRILRRLRTGLPDRDTDRKTVIEIGQPEHSKVTTCAYCGVGCSFKAEMRGQELVRMVPYKDGKANRGTPASRAVLPMAMPITATASSTRWCAKRSPTHGVK